MSPRIFSPFRALNRWLVNRGFRKAKNICPRCGSAEVTPIVYGLPGRDLSKRAERGEIFLGGCIVWPGRPEWACRSCDFAWGPSDVPKR